MARKNYGKPFENKIREQLEDAGIYCLRLFDPPKGYKGIANPCDILLHRKGVTYFLECKTIKKEASISIYSNDPEGKHIYGNVSNGQWEGLLQAQESGIVSGLLVWWVARDTTKFIPIKTAERLRNNGAKSIRYDVSGGGVTELHGVKKRVYFDYDFERFFQDLFGA